MGPRILVVNVNWVGDVLLSTPALRALRKKYPEAYLACLVPERCRALLAHNPHVNEVLDFPDRRGLWANFRSLEVIAALRRRRFDTAIFFHRSKTKVGWAVLAGIPERLGFDEGLRNRLLTGVCPRPAGRMHRTDIFLHLLRHFGVPSAGRAPDFFPDGTAEPKLRRLFQDRALPWDEPYAVVHAGGNWALKRWPAAHFTEWIRLYLKRYGSRVILCGTSSEKTLCEKIRSGFPADRVVSFCGETSLDVLAVLLKRAEIFLSNDSGPIHLAASQRANIAGLFGPTHPEETGPVSDGRMVFLGRDVGCEVPCYFRSCRERYCMESLTPQEVFEATERLRGYAP